MPQQHRPIDPNLLADMPPERARQLVVAILKMQAVMRARMEQEAMRQQAMQGQLERAMIKERMMNKTSAENWYKLTSEALEEGMNKSANPLLRALGGGALGALGGGALGAGGGALAGLPVGALLGLFQRPEAGQSRWDLIKKRLGQGAGYGAAIGGGLGMGQGALSGAASGVLSGAAGG